MAMRCSGQKAGEGMAATTAYLFGRKTDEKMAAYWPHESDENPIAAHLNATPKCVVTTTLRNPIGRAPTSSTATSPSRSGT
jgi:hypothetical protein